uniref:Uncharacterized protein n=1 Tax=Eutreptiella gymnastica TaxID=73025 RepID=A0A7S4C8U9_9EUGL
MFGKDSFRFLASRTHQKRAAAGTLPFGALQRKRSSYSPKCMSERCGGVDEGEGQTADLFPRCLAVPGPEREGLARCRTPRPTVVGERGGKSLAEGNGLRLAQAP